MPRPNILFLMTDQQQAGTIDPGSPCLTPALDRLASQGVRFSRAYTVNAICSPTRASLLTGVYPSTHGMVDTTHVVEPYRAELDTSLEMWSQRLHANGYRLGYFGKWHVERSNRLERFGFEEYAVSPGGGLHEGFEQYRKQMGLGPRPANLSPHYEVEQPGYRPYRLFGVHDEPVESTLEHYIYSHGIDFMRRAAASGQPWVTFISTSAPGESCVIPRPYWERYDPGQIRKPASFHDNLADRPNIYRRMKETWAGMEWDDFARTIAAYYGFCSLVDDQIARALQALEETGQAGNTIVIYTNDHGTMMGAHGLMCLGVFPFEEGYRIPMIVRWPGLTSPGTTCDDLVSIMDLAPTILDMTDTGTLEPCHARSLVPLLRGHTPADWRDDHFAEFHGQRFFWTQRIVWWDRYKYVFNGFDYDELYDLEADPHEMTNLALDHRYASLCRQMAERMWRHIWEINDYNMYGSHYGMFRFAPVGPDVARPGPGV